VRNGWPWLILRLVLIAVAFGPPEVTTLPASGALTRTELLALGGLLTTLGALLVVGLIGLIRVSRPGSLRWHRPSWFRRPIFGEPLQFFHAVAFAALAAGLGGWFVAFQSDSTRLAVPVMVLGLGFGLLVGVRVAVIAFRGSFIPDGV
jgi:hypothetical protein